MTLHLENMSLTTLTICGNHKCSTVRYTKHTRLPQTHQNMERTRKRFRSSPCHHIDAETGNPRSHHFEPSHLRALNGQLLWLGMQCLPQLLAPLSLLMGPTPQATVGTIYEVNQLARKATAWARTPLKIHAHHSPVVVTYTDAGWTTRPDGTSQGRQLVFIANSELLQGRESNKSLVSWHSSRLRRVARSSSAAETQAVADGDDEAVYVKFCSDSWICKTGSLKRDKFLLLWWWTVMVFTTPWLALRLLVLV